MSYKCLYCIKINYHRSLAWCNYKVFLNCCCLHAHGTHGVVASGVWDWDMLVTLVMGCYFISAEPKHSNLKHGLFDSWCVNLNVTTSLVFNRRQFFRQICFMAWWLSYWLPATNGYLTLAVSDIFLPKLVNVTLIAQNNGERKLTLSTFYWSPINSSFVPQQNLCK